MQTQQQPDTDIPQSMLDTRTVVVKCEGADLVDINDLVVIQGDLKELSQENYTKLVKSITTKGFIAPFFVWKDGGRNCLLDGTQRHRVLTDMRSKGFHIPPLPVAWIEAENLADAKEKLLQITSAYGQVDGQGLYEFSVDIPDFKDTLGDFKLPDFDLGNFAGSYFADTQGSGLTDDDHVPEVTTPVTKSGDLWLLNNHRVLCGDSMVTDTIEKLMSGNKADMVFTDPPYGYKYESNYQTKHSMLKNDDKILDFLPICSLFMENNSAIYLCTSHQVIEKWKPLIDKNFTYKNMIVWKKNNWSMGDLAGAYAGQHEIILFAHKGKVSIEGKRDTDVWEFKRTAPELHPTQKTVELIEYAITKITCNKVMDLFLGSGSTLIACEKTNRKCYGMEIDPHYCDVIVNRWQEYTGKQAVLESSGEPYGNIQEKPQVDMS